MPDPMLTALRQAAGPPHEPSAAARDRALAALRREIDRERRPRRRRRRLALGGALAAGALALAGAGYAVIDGDARPEVGIGCYGAPSLDADTTVVGVDGRPAVTICRALWRSGVVGAQPAEPPLTACTGGGAIRVFPTADASVCSRLGLVHAPRAGADPQARRFAALRDALVARVEPACLRPATAAGAAREELAARGFTGWRVEVTGADDGCASLAFDSARRVVTIVAL
jgi:hypothetical protein